MDIKLPIGIEDFGKLRERGFYYVDKTGFIRELLNRQFEANLVTRPRRFGKTLTISMLEHFFDIRKDSKAYFEGLSISEDAELCEEWMNKWPVVTVSLKSVEGLNFKDAYGMLEVLLANMCKRYEFLVESDTVNPADKELFTRMMYRKVDSETVKDSLVLFTRMMSDYYGKQTILLIDEYDVPLAKASENGYYQEMLAVIRSILGGSLKTNPYLRFAVVTGCLRISKESIFTGINNLMVDDIIGGGFNEYLGFTPPEVQQFLTDMGLADHMDEVREWYDGYRFGDTEVYCPWAVLNHVYALTKNPHARPRTYWANTSRNGVIYQYISRRLTSVKTSLDDLMAGKVLITEIEENLTYDYMKSSAKNFWSMLYLTGYLTSANPAELETEVPDGYMALRIPNKEVRKIFQNNILEWYDSYVAKIDRTDIMNAMWSGDTNKAQQLLSALLLKTVSYYDYQESFYHAFLAGLFAGDEYEVESNSEYGVGRPDVVIRDDERQRAIVIEVKYAKTESEISAKRKEAADQFVKERYLEGVPDDYTEKIGYSAVFYSKRCFLDRI